MKFLIFIFVVASNPIQGQSVIDEFCEKYDLVYQAPLDKKIDALNTGSIKYFDYDFGLFLKDEQLAILVKGHQKSDSYVPHVHFPATVATLATNNQDFSIRQLSGVTSDKTSVVWSAQSYFAPKDGMSRYEFASLKHVFMLDGRLVEVLYLYDNEDAILPELFNFSRER